MHGGTVSGLAITDNPRRTVITLLDNGPEQIHFHLPGHFHNSCLGYGNINPDVVRSAKAIHPAGSFNGDGFQGGRACSKTSWKILPGDYVFGYRECSFLVL